MMHFRNRFLAGSLVVLMAVSSIQYPAGNVRAEEAIEETKETETGTQETDSSRNVEESISNDTETVIESTEIVESTESTESATESMGIVESTEAAETGTAVEGTESMESTEETGTAETESESEEQEETTETEETIAESEEETETEQTLKVSEGDIASGSYENVTWVIDANGKLTVEGTGEFTDKAENILSRAPWYQYRWNIKSAEINLKGVLNVAGMFYGCYELTEVNLGGLDTSSVTNMSNMFYDCSSLAEINLSGLDTSSVTNMSNMFYECGNLAKIDLSGLNTSSVINMSNMFYECGNLAEINLSGLDTSSVRNMSNMFYRCWNLAEINLSGLDISSVTNMSNMFYECGSLAKIDLSGLNTSSVTNIGGMFYNCRSLAEINLSGVDLSNAADKSDMLFGCDGLNIIHAPCNLKGQVKLPESSVYIWKTSEGQTITALPENLSDSIIITKEEIKGGSYKNITWSIDENRKLTVKGTGEFSGSTGYRRAPWYGHKIYSVEISITDMTDASGMFSGCSGLTEIDLSGIDTSKVTNMAYMFSGCSGLTEIDLSGIDTSKVTNMEDMFSGCSSLTKLDLSGIDTSSVTNMSGMFSGCGLTEIDLNGIDTSKVTNMTYMFDDCSGLTSVDLSGVKLEKVVDISSMFAYCENLTDVNLSGADFSSVTNIEYIFYGCEKLTNADFSNADFSSLKRLHKMFSSYNEGTPCTALHSVDMSNADFGSVTSLNLMFVGCTNLTNVDFSGANFENVTSMQRMFSYYYKENEEGEDRYYIDDEESVCINLQSINMSNVNLGRVTNLDGIFLGCSSLKDVDLHGANFGSLTTLGNLFLGGSIAKVDLHEANFGSVTSMGHIFAKASLTDVDLSNADFGKVSSLEGVFSYSYNRYDDETDQMVSTTVYSKNLQTVNMSNANFCSLTNMKNTFRGCGKLTEINLSGIDTSRVTDMGGMFGGCSGLTKIDLSVLDTGSVTNMEGIFSGCDGLAEIDLSMLDTNNIINMSNMFSGCSSLTDVHFSTVSIDEIEDMSSMFSGCSSLKNIDLSNFNGANVKSISNIFSECDQLETIYTPYNLRVSETLSGDWYKADGTKVSILPRRLAYSILIMKGQVPSVKGVSIKAVKKKTVYHCGDILHTDDLTVRCYDTEGTVRKISDYTTNADKIDMSTAGIKPLIIAYRGYMTEVPITVKGNETPVKISGLTISDSIYTSTPFTYTGTPNVVTDTGEDVTADIILTYTYTGIMADGNPYETSLTAPVNAGNYILTVAVDKSDKKYSGSTEYAFKITKAPIELVVSDMTLTVGSPVPETFEYQTKGLLNGDKLIKMPSFICNADMTKIGIYGIVPYGANAGMNYEISYINGTLIVKESEKESVLISGISISDTTYTGKEVAYNGKASVKREDGTDITDNISLTCTYSGKQADGSEYTSTGTAPVNAGSYTLTVAVPQENEDYKGSVEYPFEITRTAVAVTALDKTFLTNGDTKLPAIYPYEVAGLLNGDKLTAEPSFAYIDKDGKEIARDDIDLKKAGQYTVLPRSADAGMNYMINYHKGILTITENLPDDGSSEVLPDDIPETGIPEKNMIWASSIEDQSYTGAAVKPAVRVYFGNKRLTEKTDYTIAYKNNRQPGTAELVITGKGNYTDKKTLHFKILPKDIADKDIIIEDMAYADNGKPHKTAPSVIYNGKKLKAGRDFDITYGEGDYTAAGVYYAVITGKGNFTGTYDRVKTTIIDKNMLVNKAKIARIPNQEYRKGQEIILADSMVNVTLNGMTLVKDTDYTVSYVNNQNVGKASVVIKGIGKYAGTKTASFKIVRTPVNLAEASFTCDFDRETVFSKGGCKPVPKVSYDGETLQNGTDYTISYKNNKKCGTALLTVKGKGNYKGSRTFEFTVKPKELSAVAVRTVDTVYVNKANKYQSKPVLTDTDGNVLKAGTDYTVTRYEHDGKTLGKQDCPPENAVITVTIEGKGSYQGTCTAAYQLRTGTSLKNAKITVANQIYTGVSIKPEENAITGASIKKNGTVENLVYGRDYEIAAYGTNIKKGIGTVVLRGLGNYYGEKTVKFKITGKSVE